MIWLPAALKEVPPEIREAWKEWLEKATQNLKDAEARRTPP